MPLLLLLALLPAAAVAAPVLTRVTPAQGPDSGGFRVTIDGTELPFSGAEVASLTVAGNVPCKQVTVDVPFRRLSCQLPPCSKCGSTSIVLRVASGAVSNALPFEYVGECYALQPDGRAPLLPPRGSGAENCTICREVVGLAFAATRDVTTHAGIRDALREVCSARSIRDYGSVRTTRCRIDLSIGCTVLFHALGDAMADAMWKYWNEAALFGRLPDTVCAAVGRCASPLKEL